MIKRLFLLLIAAQILFVHTVHAQEPSNPNAPPSERHEFVIANFKTESGVTLPQARMVYGTYGQLNAAKDNVDSAAVTLHGRLSRVRMADRDGKARWIRRNCSWSPPNCSATATPLRPATRRSRFTDRAFP